MRTEAATAESVNGSGVWLFCDGCGRTSDHWDTDHPLDGCSGSVKHAALVAFGDGLAVIDADTGELLEVRKPGQHERFRVVDRDTAEWVLSLLTEVETEALALDRRRTALLANMDAMIRDQQGRAAWIKVRFGDELKAWAASELEGEKTRSIRTPFGVLSFRKKPARVVIDDEERALAWAKVNAPFSVKTVESVYISQLDTLDVEVPPPGFKTVAESEEFSVKTGIR